MNNRDRILKAIEYFKLMKPSKLVIGDGVIHPKRWLELQAFVTLVQDYVNDGK